MAAAMDAFEFADELGVDQCALAEALAHGTGGSAAAGIVADAGFDTEYLRVNSAPYFMKDLKVLVGIARAKGIRAPESLAWTSRAAPFSTPDRTWTACYALTASQRISPTSSVSLRGTARTRIPWCTSTSETSRPGMRMSSSSSSRTSTM